MLPYLQRFKHTFARIFSHSQHPDLRPLIEPLPRQSHDDRLELLVAQWHATITPHSSADEAALVKLSRTQPKAKAIVHQHLHAIGAFVDEQVRMMSSRFSEHIHNAGQRFIYPGTHVDRFHRK